MKNKNKKIKITALILVLCITLGYALLRTGLNINGIATIPRVSWEVYFANAQETQNTNVEATTSPSAPPASKVTTISYEVELTEPGDIYEFTVDVVNDGTIDALISIQAYLNDVEISPQNPIPIYLIYYIADENDNPLIDGHRLNHETSETVKVRLEFDSEVDPQDLPSQTSLKLDIVLTAEKAARETTSTVYTLSLGRNGEADTQIGQSIPNVVNTSVTPELTREHWIDVAGATRPFYLKHTLNGNNIITESYVEFVVTPEMVEDNPGMVAGTYTLRGGGGTNCIYNSSTYAYECDVNSPYYENNADVIKEAFGYANHPDRCYGFDDFFRCSVSNLGVNADAQGDVYAGDELLTTYISTCSITAEEKSRCSYCDTKIGC